MAKRSNPETSTAAYKSLRIEDLNDTYREVVAALNEIGNGTFEDIAAHLKCSPSKIWKRLSELEKMEFIYRPGTKKTLKSGRQGFEWAIRKAGEEVPHRQYVQYTRGKTIPSHLLFPI